MTKAPRLRMDSTREAKSQVTINNTFMISGTRHTRVCRS